MPIFGDNSYQKNKVYYRRKSLRLHNYAISLAAGVCLLAGLYFITHRKPAAQDNIDELSTSSLALHEPIKYYHLKYFEGNKKDGEAEVDASRA
jgi:hypothetical protein